MRTIKFRGRCSKYSKYAGEWVTGQVVIPEDIKNNEVLILHAISENITTTYHVDYRTIGQFTGLYDKDGKEIYEGDIIQWMGCVVVAVEFRYGSFGYTLYSDEGFIPFGENYMFTFNPLNKDNHFKVVGNIHDEN